MKIELNKNSWHFNYYSAVISSNPPKSLCPYFWSLVAITLFAPLILLFLLAAKIGRLLPKKNKITKSPFDMNQEELSKHLEKYNKQAKQAKKAEKTGKIVFLFFISLVVFVICFGFYEIIQRDGFFQTIINLFTIFGFFSFLFLIINFLIDKNVGSKVGKLFGRVFKIPLAMINSFYEKNCPLISWS